MRQIKVLAVFKPGQLFDIGQLIGGKDQCLQGFCLLELGREGLDAISCDIEDLKITKEVYLFRNVLKLVASRI